MKCTHSKERGFAAIAAIFLIVVLAALGGFMLTFSNTQQLTSAQDVLGSRSYWAARAGIEWGIGSTPTSTAVCSPPPLSACTPSPAGCPSTTLTVDVFSVNVSCAAQCYCDGGVPASIYQFTSVAKSAGSVGTVGYIERSVSASIEK